mmetsp:Transcript_38998/g.91243  ORF Transcript_38998/g.91243 Transcript_38998/m.91243 type:complete len:225 (+) Transcript_38998:721-1395(+)
MFSSEELREKLEPRENRLSRRSEQELLLSASSSSRRRLSGGGVEATRMGAVLLADVPSAVVRAVSSCGDSDDVEGCARGRIRPWRVCGDVARCSMSASCINRCPRDFHRWSLSSSTSRSSDSRAVTSVSPTLIRSSSSSVAHSDPLSGSARGESSPQSSPQLSSHSARSDETHWVLSGMVMGALQVLLGGECDGEGHSSHDADGSRPANDGFSPSGVGGGVESS